jgi:DNA-directed RNA polymerase subunit N (RpoN/RPB10)
MTPCFLDFRDNLRVSHSRILLLENPTMKLVEDDLRVRKHCFRRMMLLHMIVQIRLLREGTITLRTGVWLLSRMSRTDMDFQPILLWKDLITRLTCVLREVRILMIHDQTLLDCRNLP